VRLRRQIGLLDGCSSKTNSYHLVFYACGRAVGLPGWLDGDTGDTALKEAQLLLASDFEETKNVMMIFLGDPALGRRKTT